MIRRQMNPGDFRKGPDIFKFVDLYIDEKLYGTIDVSSKSSIYAEDVVENWENGILKNDNNFIKKVEK